MLLAFALQTSILVQPLYLGETPPESRAIRILALDYAGARGAPERAPRTREQALAECEALLAELGAGADFEALARTRSSHPSSEFGGVLGTFFPGLLAPELDAFLFRAQPGETSSVIDTPFGFEIAQRVDAEAACRQIVIDGLTAASRAEARAVLAELHSGASFAELAREHSDDESAARGGDYGIYERGPRDRLLKEALFDLEVGALSTVLETPLGLHILQRVPLAEMDPGLRRRQVARVRGILVSAATSTELQNPPRRDAVDAEALAQELSRRIRAGADMAELAAEYNDDPGGRERRGDLGWVRRDSPQAAAFLDRAFLAPLGELVGPVPTTAGWVLLRREL